MLHFPYQLLKHLLGTVPMVVAPGKLMGVRTQVLPRHPNVSPTDREFQTSPEPLQGVNVRVSAGKLPAAMLYRLVDVADLS